MSDRARALAAVALLTAGVIAWAAAPLSGGSAGTLIAMVAAVGCGAAGLAGLVVGDAQVGSGVFDPLPVRLAADAAHVLRVVPWSQAMIVAVLVLEVLHPARPWHTGVLGVALLALTLAAHLAETGGAPRAALGPQAPVLAAGVGPDRPGRGRRRPPGAARRPGCHRPARGGRSGRRPGRRPRPPGPAPALIVTDPGRFPVPDRSRS